MYTLSKKNAKEREMKAPSTFDNRLYSIADDFWSRISEQSDGCWHWGGYKRKDLRGVVMYLAHRLAYELAVGRIPDNYVLDHLCSNPACVNPAHLEAVTQGENLARASTVISTVNRRKTHCPQGHEYTPENTRYDRKSRGCRTCGNERTKRYQRAGYYSAAAKATRRLHKKDLNEIS